MDDKNDKLDDLASGLDELTTTVEELEADRPNGSDATTLKSVKKSLKGASDAVDDLQDEREN